MEEKNQFDRMTQTPVPKLIIALGIPTIITMLITNIYNLADTYFVSQIGESASAAIGVVYALMAVLQAIGFMLGQGAGSNISRKLGAKDSVSAGIFASTSFFSALFLGGVVSVFGLIFLDPFMKLLGSTDTILPYSRIYGAYILLAAPAMTTSCVMNNILRFEGKAKLAMIGLTTGGILNMIGDPIFMFRFKMGISGAGLSTALSQYISAGILLYMFLSGKTQSKLSIHNITRKRSLAGNILFTGFPSFVRQGLQSISSMCLNHSAAVYGDAAIAAMSIVARFCAFLFCVGLGIGQGFQPVAGFNYGAGKYTRVRKGFQFTVMFGTILLGFFAVFGMVGADKIVRMFCNEAKVIEIGTFALRIQCVALFFIPISVSGNMMFQSIGKSGRATILSSLRSGLFFIPLILFLPKIFGLRGIQMAQPLADVMASAFTVPFILRLFATMPKDREKPEKNRKK